MQRKCKADVDAFCYVCGKLTTKAKRRPISNRMRVAYALYFGLKVSHQEKNWVPHFSCEYCYTTLIHWLSGNSKAIMPFAKPMVWCEPTNHLNDCYFCINNIVGLSGKWRDSIRYNYASSAKQPVGYSDQFPVPEPPLQDTITMEESATFSKEEVSLDTSEVTMYEPSCFVPMESHKVRQAELNDLVRELGLPKADAELLASRLRDWKLLDNDVKVTGFRNRSNEFANKYIMRDSLCYCIDIEGLFKEFRCPFVASQ
jgi:hypothetical protein